MKNLFNWTVGSFFRTIGRIFAYLIIGAIIALILMYKPKAATLTSYDTYSRIMNQESGCGTSNRYSYTQYSNNDPGGDLWNSGSFNTQYSGKAAILVFNFQYNLTVNKYYDVEINFNTSDLSSSLTTSNVLIDSGTSCQDLSGNRVSLIGFTLSNSGTNYSNKATIRIMANTSTTYWGIQLYKGVGQFVTGVNNWRINSITINEVDPSNTNIIIDNATNNTQNIINNNNNNTQQIIDNQNQNLQQQNINDIDNKRNSFDTINNDCGDLYKYNMIKGKRFNNSGNLIDAEAYYYTESYIKLNTTDKIVLSGFGSEGTGTLIVYDSNKNFLDYWTVYDRNVNLSTLQDPYYFRISTNMPTGMAFKNKGCKSKIDTLNDSVNNLTDTLTDTDTQSDSNDVGNFLNNISLGSHNTIASIITLPINMLNDLLNGSNTADLCTTYKQKQICFPSGNLIWGRNNTLINTFKLFFQLVVGGYLSYKCLSSIVRVIEHAVQPDKSMAEVMKL